VSAKVKTCVSAGPFVLPCHSLKKSLLLIGSSGVIFSPFEWTALFHLQQNSMILPELEKKDFDFTKTIVPDRENKGFSEEEIKQLAGEQVEAGAKGMKDWLNSLWPKNRKLPPEIQDLKSNFGYQSQPFLWDLVKTANEQNTPLSGQIKVLSPHFNFYVMQCGVYIEPDGGEKFEALKFKVTYKNHQASTYSMLPAPEQKKIFEMGGKADIGLTGSAEFGFPEISIEHAKADAAALAKLEANFIISFHYELKTQLVDAFGKGNPFCKWLMHRGDKLRNDVVFYPVIKVPKTVKQFECEFEAYFKIGHPGWKNSEFFLKPVYKTKVAC
jgi:hypothetical protein